MNRMLPLLAASLLLSAAAYAAEKATAAADPPAAEAPDLTAPPPPPARSAGEVIDDAKDATNAAIEAAKAGDPEGHRRGQGQYRRQARSGQEGERGRARSGPRRDQAAGQGRRGSARGARQGQAGDVGGVRQGQGRCRRAQQGLDEIDRSIPAAERSTALQRTRARAICASPSQIHRSGTRSLVPHGAGGGVRLAAASRQASQPAEASTRLGPERAQVRAAGGGSAAGGAAAGASTAAGAVAGTGSGV